MNETENTSKRFKPWVYHVLYILRKLSVLLWIWTLTFGLTWLFSLKSTGDFLIGILNAIGSSSLIATILVGLAGIAVVLASPVIAFYFVKYWAICLWKGAVWIVSDDYHGDWNGE